MSPGKKQNDVSETMAQIAEELRKPRSLADLLARIVHTAVDLLTPCDHAGVLLVFPGSKVVTATTTSGVVIDTNHAQGRFREGPCFDAAREGITYRVVDMRAETRWPRFAPHARELGIGSMIGYQLFASRDRLGALDLYSEKPYGFTPVSERIGWILASHAAVALNCSSQEAVEALAQ